MNHVQRSNSRRFRVTAAWWLLLAASAWVCGEPAPAAMSGFNAYVARVEARLADQHHSVGTFLAPADWSRLRKGDMIIDQLTATDGTELPGALLHDWRGTAFVPRAKGADFERTMRDFDAYEKYYAPEVLTARVLAHEGDRYEMTMRVRQQHVLTVVMDATYEVTFGRLDEAHGYSLSRSTGIAEIDSPGTDHERALSASEDHGFLWRMNTYWSYEERDGGVYIQIESVTLTRSIPLGLGWAVDPFTASIPRDSLEFTLHSTCNAIRKRG